jgi:ATP-dependent DNA ligase
MLLGRAGDDGELYYVGRVEHGLDDRLARELLPRLEKLRRDEPALVPDSRPAGGVAFGHLRHAVLKGVERVGQRK